MTRLDRRSFLGVSGAGLSWLLLPENARLLAGDAPSNDPLAEMKYEWTAKLRWNTVVDLTRVPGGNDDEKLANAQGMLAARGGGTVYFPPGTYRFRESIRLADGVILRGADPSEVKRAHDKKYALASKIEFPRYEPAFEGDGAPLGKAFKGIYLQAPATASNCGVVNLDINRGHIHFLDDNTIRHGAGTNRVVFGCIVRNAAVADIDVPNLALGQKPWQRFTDRNSAAIDVHVAANALVANNRLPPSEDGFTMNGYVLLNEHGQPKSLDGVLFDYDNRPGVLVNHFGIGLEGTPETFPWAFRPGLVIRDNFVFNTGRLGIGFAGQGVRCFNNAVQFARDVWRPTVNGQQITTGSSTNANRAIDLRGWGWQVEGNAYLAFPNLAADRTTRLADGEGPIHDGFANAYVRDSVLRRNQGNASLTVYRCGGIDGLLIEENEILLPGPPRRGAFGIYASADRERGRYPCYDAQILRNRLAGGGIFLGGQPSRANVIRDNRNVGEGTLRITIHAEARIDNNAGFEVLKG